MTARLSIDITPEGPSRVVIAVAGEIDLATAPQLTQCLLDHVDRDVVLDLSAVTFLDSSGISALIRGREALRAADHSLQTMREQEHVQRVLEIAGIADLLHGSPD
jgi:anti-anti-sigma factor